MSMQNALSGRIRQKKLRESDSQDQRGLSQARIDFDLTIHIFSISATMVGVCLTVISLFIISRKLDKVKSIGEILLAIDAFVFIVSCTVSYIALMARRSRRQHNLETNAERLFFLGLFFMVCICILLVSQFI